MGRFGFGHWVVLLALALAPGWVSRGKETWLQPERFAVTPGANFRVDLTTGEGFAGLVTAPDLTLVDRVSARLADQPVTIGLPGVGLRSLYYGVTVPRPGVAVVAVELKPASLERAGPEIEAYFRSIHAPEALRVAWTQVAPPARWRENTVRHATTFIRVGEPPAGDRSWSVAMGLGLEIVPERDPTLLRAGDAFPVRVLRRGAPVAGLVLAFVSDGETREHVAQTDENGRASAVLDVSGLWLVHGTELRRSNADDHEWESEATTLMVAVGAPTAKST